MVRASKTYGCSLCHLRLQAEGALDKAWDATDVAKKTRVKLGGGFYCGQIEVEGVKCARHGHDTCATTPAPPVPPSRPCLYYTYTWLRPLTTLTRRAGTWQVLHVQRLLHDDARQVHGARHQHPLLRRRVRPDEALARPARSKRPGSQPRGAARRSIRPARSPGAALWTLARRKEDAAALFGLPKVADATAFGRPGGRTSVAPSLAPPTPRTRRRARSAASSLRTGRSSG